MSYQEYKNKIVQFYKNNRRVPGYVEIMKLVSFKSKNAVYKLINKMVDEGIFSKDSRGKLTPLHPFGEVALLGLVEAGIPTTAEQESLDTVSLDEFLVDTSKDSYMLRVKGDSMIDAHIKEGDYVLVERRQHAKDGEIVIADVDGGWTMKYYRCLKNGRPCSPYLQPANELFSDIHPENDLQIAAVVKAVVRKY
ncbi:MAG: S24 family peptidase [bacterium]